MACGHIHARTPRIPEVESAVETLFHQLRFVNLAVPYPSAGITIPRSYQNPSKNFRPQSRNPTHCFGYARKRFQGQTAAARPGHWSVGRVDLYQRDFSAVAF